MRIAIIAVAVAYAVSVVVVGGICRAGSNRPADSKDIIAMAGHNSLELARRGCWAS